jgi:hypothetical protein
MSFDPTYLFLSLLPGGAGLILFVYGRKQQRPPQLVAGLLLMACPYFTSDSISMMAVSVAIGAGLWVALRLGW